MNQKSIAVLPFENISSDPENEYFADGVTEEIINALSQVEGLKVTARTSSFSYKGKKEDVRKIGNQLGVSTVLEGGIRKAGKRVRVSAQLIRTDNGFQIWSESFDRELTDIFELQDEISLHIADRIRENYGHLEIADHLAKKPTENLQAYDLYLRGRYNHLKWDREGIENGMRFYEESIREDPQFAHPYFGIAFCYAMYGSWMKRPELLDLAEDYIQKGFAIDSQSDLGYFAKATLEFWGRWNFIEGEKSYHKAIALNSSNSEAMEGLAELYIAIGYFEKAKEQTERALRINPISANHLFTMGDILYMQNHIEQALSYFDASLRADRLFEHAIAYKQLVLIQLGHKDRLESFMEAYDSRPDNILCRALFSVMHPDLSSEISKEEALRLAVESEEIGLIGWKLYLLAHLGKKDEALRFLEKVVRNKEGQYINFSHMPLLEPLQSEQSYHDLVSRVFSPASLPDKSRAFSPTEAEKKSLMDEEEIQSISEKLAFLMDEEKAYLNPTLSLRELAEKLELGSNKLSWYLNEIVGKSFSEFINGRRIEEFKRKARDENYTHLSLLGLALESGFNSKSVFNDNFKKATGSTPSNWLKENR